MRLALVLVCMLGLMFAPVATIHASDLKPETVAAFDRYVRATEARMQDDLHNDGFLVIDRLPPSRQRRAHDRVRNGEIYIQQLHTREDGRSIDIPSGLIHHWVAVIFVPGKTLSQAVAVLQDYDIHQDIYKPEVRRSQLLNRTPDGVKIYLQFYVKSIVTAVFNANFDVSYDDPDTARFETTSRSTRIAEVQNAGEKDERELPVGHDRGFLWRMNSYWRVEERDGGLYLQDESIVLTRRVPAIMAWIVNPLLESIPRALLSKLLFGTRDGMDRRDSSRSQILSPTAPIQGLLQWPHALTDPTQRCTQICPASLTRTQQAGSLSQLSPSQFAPFLRFRDRKRLRDRGELIQFLF